MQRSIGSNRGNSFGRFLERLRVEIDEEHAVLREIMRALGIGEDPLKQLAAIAAERAGRLKLNGSLLGYSPLSRLIELEALALGVEGKRSLWRTLLELDDARLAAFDLDTLERRAARQRRRLERQRRAAARLAFGAERGG